MENTLTKPFVLYVDDDEEDISLVREAFENYPKIELFTFTDSYKFLKYIIECKPFHRTPSLILIDVNMPLINGKELLTMLRSYEELRHVKIVLYTTSTQPYDSQFAKNLGAGFISKPTSMKDLNKIVQRLLVDCELIPC